MKSNKALIVVDLQNDFMTHGSTPIPNSENVVLKVNELLSKFELIIFTKDWHPENQIGFASQHQGLLPYNKTSDGDVVYPDHCIQDTIGANLYDGIDFGKCLKDFYIIKKGLDSDFHPHGAFELDEEILLPPSELHEFLKEHKVTDVYVCGLAGDFEVKETAIESSILGYNTVYIIDAVSYRYDLDQTIKELTESNVKIIESWELPLFNLI